MYRIPKKETLYPILHKPTINMLKCTLVYC